MKYNINDNVKVILTNRGIRVMKRENPNMFEFHFNPETREVNEQLWVIMNTFGDEMIMGVGNVFENNTIIFEDQEDTNNVKKIKKDFVDSINRGISDVENGNVYGTNEIKEIKKAIEWAYNKFKPI